MQALAWFGDAMVQHAETYWSLFAVDMDALLEMQPADTWDSFPLFQMLNNYLRTHGMSLETGIARHEIVWDENAVQQDHITAF